jgi:hypothetical protein
MAFGTLKFDTLTTSDSANTSTEKSLDTSYVFNGTAKAWVHYGTITSTAIRDSFNISSLDDTATGKTVVHISNDFVNDDYCATMYNNAHSSTFDNQYTGGLFDRNVGDLDVWTHGASGYADSSLCDVLFHGDLA